jgi:hypothetical protein
MMSAPTQALRDPLTSRNGITMTSSRSGPLALPLALPLAFAMLVSVMACSDDPVSQTLPDQSMVGATAQSDQSANDNDNGNGNHGSKKRFIAVRDDCDPTDPAWAPTGGCVLKGGSVNFAEFNAFLASPLSLSTVGHPAWRNEPSYVKVEEGQSVRVTNEGGRLHTFTLVAHFGGGRVPPLNIGLTPAPECLSNTSSDLAPGATLRISGLPEGTSKFQCCIHPWMRAAINVLPEHKGHLSS